MDVIAVTQTPVPERLVFKLENDQLAELNWEGERILVGRAPVLLAALRNQHYDVIISLSIEYPILELAMQISATVRYGTPHNYYLPPFGPFRRFPVRAGHIDMLKRLDALLSPCEHHCEFLRRWGYDGLIARPLYAADYHYFHSDACLEGPAGEGRALRLAAAMCPWEPSHRYVTMVSPAPEKGLAIFVTLARRLPHVAFAAVTTQWTGQLTVAKLQQVPNITLIPANPDVDLVFRQTRVLLAPSLWQECCPLIVMESCLRGIPCISSDVFGLPEANSNPRLVAHASLCYDHARGILHHGMSNAQLEARLGGDPPLPTDEARASAIKASTEEEATAEEVAPFEQLLVELLGDENLLRRESAVCRSTFLAFAQRREGGLRRELEAISVGRRRASGGGQGESATDAWRDALAAATALGYTVARVTEADVRQRRAGRADEPSADGAASQQSDDGLPADDRSLVSLPRGTAYRVVHQPYVFLRTAPSTDAAIHHIVESGRAFEVDGLRNGWVRTASAIPGAMTGRTCRAWALVDATSLGLGVLLERV